MKQYQYETVRPSGVEFALRIDLPFRLQTFIQNLLAVLQPVLRKLTIPDWRKAHGLLRWLEVYIYIPLPMFWLGPGLYWLYSRPILSHVTKGFFQNRFIQMHHQERSYPGSSPTGGSSGGQSSFSADRLLGFFGCPGRVRDFHPKLICSVCFFRTHTSNTFFDPLCPFFPSLELLRNKQVARWRQHWHSNFATSIADRMY